MEDAVTEDAAAAEPLLRIEDLRVSFKLRNGRVPVLQGVSLTVERDETVAVVGESGSGKSMLAYSIIGVLPPGAGIDGGQIIFDGRDLLSLTRKEMRGVKGRQISMVFQEPMTSLNPALRIGGQVGEPAALHLGLNRSDARDRALELLQRVRIPNTQSHMHDYPHQLSGGMCQRAMVAMALACDPQLLIADEPTTALDVTVQAQVLDLVKELSVGRKFSVLLITHNLGLVARYADRVVVTYAGRIVESASVEELFSNPKHPYTQGLLRSTPRLDLLTDSLVPIRGQAPTLGDFPAGCAFEPRCPLSMPKCQEEPPVETSNGHSSRCWLGLGGGTS